MKYRRLKPSEKEIIDSKIKSDNNVARIHVHVLNLKGSVPRLEPTRESNEEAEQKVRATAVKSEN